jgi:hypothetical protein
MGVLGAKIQNGDLRPVNMELSVHASGREQADRESEHTGARKEERGEMDKTGDVRDANTKRQLRPGVLASELL